MSLLSKSRSLCRAFRNAVLIGFGLSVVACNSEKKPGMKDKDITLSEAISPLKNAPADWSDWYKRQDSQMADTKNRETKTYLAWLRKFDGLEATSLINRAATANDQVNGDVDYETDALRYGKDEYYASAIETLGGYKPAGDCEDFAIAKYYALRHMGVPDSRMFLLIVSTGFNGASIDHAVLGLDTSATGNRKNCLILDNNTPHIRAIGETTLVPYYSTSPGRGPRRIWINREQAFRVYDMPFPKTGSPSL